jgi:hypothetical protein
MAEVIPVKFNALCGVSMAAQNPLGDLIQLPKKES